MMKIIFFGSDDFAVAHLESLIGSDHKVIACVTQPDRPKGRGMNVIVSPVKECAQKHKIFLLQPEVLTEPSFVSCLKDFKSDMFVVIAYGKFLPTEVLNIPPQGAINVHGSLLPKYRGAAPINWAIINGEKESGLSIIKINERMDAGDILAQKVISIDEGETAVGLRKKMMEVGRAFLLETIESLKAGCKPMLQDDHLATFAPKLIKELGSISWDTKALEICCLVRGLLPWPSAYTFYQGKLLKILEAEVVAVDATGSEPGTVIEVDKRGIVVATGDQGFLVKKVHFQDSKPMEAHSFVIGHAVEVGYKFQSSNTTKSKTSPNPQI